MDLMEQRKSHWNVVLTNAEGETLEYETRGHRRERDAEEEALIYAVGTHGTQGWCVTEIHELVPLHKAA